MKYLLMEIIKNGLYIILPFYISTIKMADNKTTMENIMRECVKALGYEAALELVNSCKPKAEEKEKPKKVEKKTETTEEKKKRIPRMSPTLANELKTELNKVGVKYSDDDKKEFEKAKKEFVSYVDDLTDDDFTSKNLTQHMHDFANTKKPAPVQEKKEEEKVVKVEEKPKRGRKPTKKEEEAPKKEEEHEVPAYSNAVTTHDVTLEELQHIKVLATPGGEPNGVYWDGDDGRFVRGPEAVKDEDLVEVGFGKETFMVGERSGRVYKESEDGGPDVFHGFVGVGRFVGMKMP